MVFGNMVLQNVLWSGLGMLAGSSQSLPGVEGLGGDKLRLSL